MEKTTIEKVLEHRGLREVVALFLRDGKRVTHCFYVKKYFDAKKYCREFAASVERGENKIRRMCGMREKLRYEFVQIIREA